MDLSGRGRATQGVEGRGKAKVTEWKEKGEGRDRRGSNLSKAG